MILPCDFASMKSSAGRRYSSIPSPYSHEVPTMHDAQPKFSACLRFEASHTAESQHDTQRVSIMLTLFVALVLSLVVAQTEAYKLWQ